MQKIIKNKKEKKKGLNSGMSTDRSDKDKGNVTPYSNSKVNDGSRTPPRLAPKNYRK